jgi:hypothetical protein
MSQTDKLHKLLRDGKWHTTPNILAEVYGSSHLGIARIGARIWDLRHRYNRTIETRRIRDTIWAYRMPRIRKPKR